MSYSPTSKFVIAGAGFYGISLADYLIKRFPVANVTVVEAGLDIMSRASRNNQARLHNGYHYPRAIKTAEASHKSYQRFRSSWPSETFENFTHIYGISRHGSHITAKQFEATMSRIGAPVRTLSKSEFSELFSGEQVETAFEVDEIAFNFQKLREWGMQVLAHPRIELRLMSRVTSVEQAKRELLLIELKSGEKLSSKYFFNATYGGIEYIKGLNDETRGIFAHQATEMNLVTPVASLSGRGITIMDGPFFSVMPYPGASCYSLSHVRYTPRARSNGNPLSEGWYFDLDWQDEANVFELMVRDAARFVPSLSQLKKIKSIREVKTLVANVKNDSRPIYFHEHQIPGCYSILGGKLDNVFDMFDFLDRLEFF